MAGISCLVLSLGACTEEPQISPEDAAAFAAGWSETVEETLLEGASRAVTTRKLKERLSKAASADRERVGRDDPPFDVFVDEVYGAKDYGLFLVSNGALTERGEAVWSALQEVERHLLPVDEYPLQSLEEKIARLKEERQGYADFQGLRPEPAEVDFVAAHLAEKTVSEFDLVEQNYPELTKLLLDDPKGARLREALTKYEAMSARKAGLEVELEQMLARSIVRYSRQMKHFHIKEIFIHPREDDFWNEPEIRRPRPDKDKGPYTAGRLWRRAAHIAEDMADKTKILHARMRETLDQILTEEDAGAVIAALAPDQPQYAALVKEHARYKKIVAEGGWEEVPVPRNLRPGQRTDEVKQLKKRLQIEGYYAADAPIDDHYDDALTAAIRAYQETHQMEVTGRPHTMFWRSVNIPAERRRQQIALNIERWRKTNVSHAADSYAFVNISDFTVELWKAQERQMRIPVVVGNNALETDIETQERSHRNRTPIMAAYIDRIIYNPYWNVTSRVRTNEILPKVKQSVEAQYAARLKQLKKRAQPPAPRPSALSNMFGAPEAEPESSGAENAEPVLTSGVAAAEDFRFSMRAVREVNQATRAAPHAQDSPLAGELSTEKLKELFPYLNPETGEVDVSVTDPNNVPRWYAENNYEVVAAGRKWEYVRMIPGVFNALGLVKIIFPNYDDVYMHDTPAKSLFNQQVRGFSFGCIRLQDPLGVAEQLLRNDGQWEDFNVAASLKNGEYLPIFLKRQVPVFLEYYTVRVDDEGRANFLSDIYNYDVFPD